ncbi:MAG: TPM domain-containing protein [Thiobacillus sp.]|nr:TPM domain-containing protein [Thiobacillus sp.]
MNILRIFKHLLYPGWLSHRRFPAASLARIESAIADSEARHHGEIRVAVETSLDLMPLLRGRTARQRALEVFCEQRVWDTEANNGVLIYLLLADRDVEILVDREIARQVDAKVWEDLCNEMENHFRDGAYESGMLHAIATVGRHLARLYPRAREDVNELSNRPVRL